MAEEKRFENKIKKFLDKLPNTWHYKHHASAYGKAGIPDIISCINGRFVGIEVKASNGKPSPLQVRNINQITCAGGYAVIVYPSEWEELKGILESISKGEL